MNNLNKNQKIAIVTIVIIIIVTIYFFFYIREQNGISEIQNNEIEIIDDKNITDQSKIEEQKETIKVHISGAVNQEGVIELEEDSRINDAIEKAGGLKENAYIDNVNLAFPLEDGMKIYIPNINEKQQMDEQIEKQKVEQQENSKNSYISKDSGTNIIDNTNTLQSNTKTKKININTANQSDLESLPGIGPSTATKIINYRNENGKFKSIEDLKEVSGIGESKFNKIKELICVK